AEPARLGFVGPRRLPAERGPEILDVVAVQRAHPFPEAALLVGVDDLGSIGLRMSREIEARPLFGRRRVGDLGPRMFRRLSGLSAFVARLFQGSLLRDVNRGSLRLR